ncbi:MAG TPA: hypothetical protein VF182_22255 [Candidatus Binatia bacterium]
MKQAFGSGDRGEFSGSTRFESKDADFSDDILTQISSMPLGIHAASNQNRRMEVMGEFILVQAILREAIRTYQKYAVKKGTRASRLFRDVNEWFSSDDRQWFFSFVNVCDTLGLEPTYIRTGLKLWRERKLQATGAAPTISEYQPIPKTLRRRLVANELRS